MLVLSTEEQVIDAIEKILRNIIIDDNGCWIWQKDINEKGYGTVHITMKRANDYCHRVAYSLWIGEIPDELPCVLHRCDITACCNPDHLFVGTKKHNGEDAVAKGRTARGNKHGSKTHPESHECGDRHWMRRMPELIQRNENHPQAILTDLQIADIREMGRNHIKQRVIADKHDTTQAYVSDILLNKARQVTQKD